MHVSLCDSNCQNARRKVEDLLQELYKRSSQRDEVIDPDLNDLRYRLAKVQVALGKYNKAIKLFDLTIEISSLNFGKRHPRTLSRINCLAHLYLKSGKIRKAQKLFAVVLEQRRIALGAYHPNTLFVKNTLQSLSRISPIQLYFPLLFQRLFKQK